MILDDLGLGLQTILKRYRKRFNVFLSYLEMPLNAQSSGM